MEDTILSLAKLIVGKYGSSLRQYTDIAFWVAIVFGAIKLIQLAIKGFIDLATSSMDFIVKWNEFKLKMKWKK